MIAVRYCSKTGNTQKMAEAIAQQLNTTAHSIETPLTQAVDQLVLGGAIHMGSMDSALKQYVQKLDPKMVKSVVMFGTSGAVLTIEKSLEKQLENRQIKVAPVRLFLHGLVPKMGNFTAKQQEEIQEFTSEIKLDQ